MKRFLARSGLFAAATVGLLGSPALAVGPETPQATPVGPAQPGAFCTFTSCRPRAASPSTAAAFGAAVLAIGWQARRREAPEA